MIQLRIVEHTDGTYTVQQKIRWLPLWIGLPQGPATVDWVVRWLADSYNYRTREEAEKVAIEYIEHRRKHPRRRVVQAYNGQKR